MIRVAFVGLLIVAGCAEEPQVPAIIAYPAYELHASPPPPPPPPLPPAHHEHEDEGQSVDPGRASRVLLLQGRKLDRPAEVVGVVDAHEPSGREDVAFQRLQERAAALGADAVVGIDFHHGEAHGESLHLSGLAVRFLDRTP